jgi:hypothetical protein
VPDGTVLSERRARIPKGVGAPRGCHLYAYIQPWPTCVLQLVLRTGDKVESRWARGGQKAVVSAAPCAEGLDA